MAEVATRKIFENERVRVWELELAPGQSSGLHTHANAYFFYVTEASELEAFDAAGNSFGRFHDPVGTVVYVDFDGQDLVHEGSKAPATHEVRNIGSGHYREVLVELK